MPIPVPDPHLDPIEQLIQVMAILRGPGGCPWDREQTHTSLRAQLIEECYEVIDAIDTADPAALREELGDLLLHIVFHAQLAAERGEFTLRTAAASIVEKLIRRHPHVFGNVNAANADEVIRNWDAIKKEEKPERQSILDGVPRTFPALMRAQETQKKAAKIGFDWPDHEGPRAKITEELAEIEAEIEAAAPLAKIEDELGDLLFATVNYARHLNIDAETALHNATRKFQTRFQAMEQIASATGTHLKDLTLDEMEELWLTQKKAEKHKTTA